MYAIDPYVWKTHHCSRGLLREGVARRSPVASRAGRLGQEVNSKPRGLEISD
ncbi:MAG: hypothetical protein VX675_07110 [Planctomycetota bacterium]|nr:hypothetical protein [Planctomycetota bacterium]